MSNLSDGKILVTGGAGFIGSALVWALNQRGSNDIIVCDRLGTDEKWKNLVGLSFSDYIDADDLESRLENDPNSLGEFSLVLHLGACSATTEKDAGFLMRNNFEFTKNLAEWAVKRGTRFVYASSAATYGDGSHGMDDSDPDLLRLEPLNMYGYSKHLFDLYAQRTGILEKIVGLKYFNVYGPNENHKDDMRSVVNKAYAQILESGTVSLFKSHRPDYKDGKQKRDFLYVKDAVAMTLHLAENPLANGLFNLGSGEANTWIDLANAIFAALGKEPNIQFVDMPETLREKYQYYTCADVMRLQESGFGQTITPLADAVADYVRNYLIPDKLLATSEQS